MPISDGKHLSLHFAAYISDTYFATGAPSNYLSEITKLPCLWFPADPLRLIGPTFSSCPFFVFVHDLLDSHVEPQNCRYVNMYR
jgi:hypothetical protein